MFFSCGFAGVSGARPGILVLVLVSRVWYFVVSGSGKMADRGDKPEETVDGRGCLVGM